MNIPAKYRIIIYYVMVVALAATFALGWFTPEQARVWVDSIITAAAMAALVMARLNVPKP